MYQFGIVAFEVLIQDVLFGRDDNKTLNTLLLREEHAQFIEQLR
jgi:hypothetical protein